ncbi:unnamed protein product [Hymenolepis diminuta]|uniref:WIF domain-containing protein n=1 Tax=Hymenolepis diminuta TaxID=6216 RepID=A0A0R3SZF9_HYMDI|nr:unnamed protein product [Hymenolepis diminuta]
MWKLRAPCEYALEKVVSRRIVNPNVGFVKWSIILEIAAYDADAATNLYFNREVYEGNDSTVG